MLTMFAEIKQDGEWRKVGREFDSTYQDCDMLLTDRVYDGRDAGLISFLSAQCWNGMPNDASEEVSTHKLMQGDVHFATLRELLDFEWDKEVCNIGYISEWQYKRLKEYGIEPANILKDPFRRDNMVITPFFMDMVIACPTLRTNGVRYYVEYKYDKSTVKDVCTFFCGQSIPKLINLIPEGGTAHDVRIVYCT